MSRGEEAGQAGSAKAGRPLPSSALLDMITATSLLIPDDEKPQTNANTACVCATRLPRVAPTLGISKRERSDTATPGCAGRSDTATPGCAGKTTQAGVPVSPK